MSIYKRLITSTTGETDVYNSNEAVVTTGLWSGDQGYLTSSTNVNLSSVQLGKSGEYYFDVYDKSISNELAEVQFSVTYGHVSGGGAPTLDNDVMAKLPTRAIYSQYRNLLLGEDDLLFKFLDASGNTTVTSNHIYVINFQRARVKERIDPGNWELPLSGSNGLFKFIDNSGDTLQAFTQTTPAGRVYAVVSGTLETGVFNTNHNGEGYGWVYPDLGIIVLNPNAITSLVGFFTQGTTLTNGTTPGTIFTAGATPPYDASDIATIDNTASPDPYAPVTASVANWASQKSAYNHAGLYISMKLALGAEQFKARSAENISSAHYFIRLRNTEFNYSNNPTFRKADNTIINSLFRNDPKVYVTTVGLYNDNNELLAVAKLSKPVRKSFSEELLLRVRLDY